MQRALLVCFAGMAGMGGVAACRYPQETQSPYLLVCSGDRIGRVEVRGANPSDVPQLVVLEGTLDNPVRTERIAEVSLDLLHARGYAQARIHVTRRRGCGVELVVDVDRGPQFRITKIAFQTNDAFPADERLAVIEGALGTVNTIGGAYVEDRMGHALASLARRYRESGWLDVEIGSPRPIYDGHLGEVTLTIPIHAGRRFKIGNVIARGGRRATRAAVIEALGLRGGQWYDAARVQAAIVRARHEVDEPIDVRFEVARDRVDLEARVGNEDRNPRLAGARSKREAFAEYDR